MLTPNEINADIRWHVQMRKALLELPYEEFDGWCADMANWHTEQINMLEGLSVAA